LTHTKNSRPGASRLDICYDCMTEGIMDRPPMVPPVAIVRAITADHSYRFTIAGRCGWAGCGRVEDDHPLIGIPDAQTGCDVSHTSISAVLLINDGGQEWTRCPRCASFVEPKMTKGFPEGRAEGRGRGYMTKRHKDELEKLRPAWLAGDR